MSSRCHRSPQEAQSSERKRAFCLGTAYMCDEALDDPKCGYSRGRRPKHRVVHAKGIPEEKSTVLHWSLVYVKEIN